MNNTYNNSEDDGDAALKIAPHTLSASSNPTVDGSEYWNLNATTFGSASFKAAWGLATGAGVTISIVDEGVNYTHLDLAGRYDTSIDYDPLDQGDSDARPDSATEGHGTEVAGVIAGSAANDFGTIGAAPDATITASYLRYGAVTIDNMVAILSHQANYDISNNSWGFTTAFTDNGDETYFAPVVDAIETAAVTGRNGLGTAMVFAAGNGKLSVGGENIGDDANFHSLANNRFSIAVGAHDSTGESAFFSSPGANVLLSAPGMAIVTTSGLGDGATGSSTVSGTSFAAPMVSSAIALMLQANPNLGYRDVQEILAISSDPSRSGLAVANGASNVNGGGMLFDREMGFGALNALSAVNLARSWAAAPHTAANEEHLAADFAVPVNADPLTQTLSCDVVSTGADFSLDFVELTLNVQDADLSDLRIELISADGTSTLIAPNLRAAGGRTALDFTFSSVATWGESPFGTWTVKLSHASASSDFKILGASLNLYGDTVGADDDHIFTASYARLVAADASRQTISDTDGGIDRLNFAAAAEGVTANLAGGANAVGDVAFVLNGQFENIFGSIHADRFAGSAASNLIEGDFGNDWIAGLEGDDFLYGGEGDDTIIGGAGADSIDGGGGKDTAAYDSQVTLNFATGQHAGAAAGDLFVRIERFALSAGNDRFVGSAAAVNEKVAGNGGKDKLAGGAGSDQLDGGKGNDKLIGGVGADTLIGGKGDDKLDGGAGRDTFVFVSTGDIDRIADFAHGKDKIDLSALDANSRISGNGKFKFIGDDDFSHKAGELRFEEQGRKTIVMADRNGDGHADFKLVLDGHHHLTAGDFIL
jgi:subtilisin-like proprotein convertase family protein